MADDSTQIDELRLDITVEDNTSGESSDKKVKNLATAISRLNKNIQAFDNTRFTKVFENMTKGLDSFFSRIEKVSSTLANLATIINKSGIEKATKNITTQLPALTTETTLSNGRKSTPIQAIQSDNLTSVSTEKTKQQLGELVEKLKEARIETNMFFDRFLSKSEKTKFEASKLKEQIAELKKELASQKVDYFSAIMGGKNVSDLQKNANKTSKEINKLQNQLDKLSQTATKSKKTLLQLVKSFGRIAMYRSIRRIIQEISQTFINSIDGIARYNNEFRQTMGNLQSSIDKARASLGVSFYQVLILIEPIIMQIANGIANFANNLAKVMANLRGVGKYTKINTEYMKEYQSATQGALLSFDTFTTLNGGQSIDYSKMFELAEDALDEEQFTQTQRVLKNILEIIRDIGKTIGLLSDVTSPLTETIITTLLPAVIGFVQPLIEIVETIVEQLTPAIDGIIKIVAGVVQQISSAFKVISGLIKLLTGDFAGAWNDIGEGFASMVNGIANMFIGLAKFIIDALNFLFVKTNPIFWVLKAFGLDVGEKISNWNADWSAKAWNPVKAYSNGGMMTGTGTLYALAGESGAEIVARGEKGTGVINVDQFTDAMVNALVRYGASRDSGNNITVQLDGNKVGQLVASSSGFRNEANRRNVGLNWK